MLRAIGAFGLILILNFPTFITCKGSISINAPGTIHSNRKYTVCVTLHNVSESATLRIGIRGNFSWSNIQTVSLQPFETTMLDFYPPKLDTRKIYTLFCDGIKGLDYHGSALIKVGTRDGANIYIETDKGAYKPGDLLHYRVVILNEHAKPMKIREPIKIQIFDSLNNRVKQYKDIRLNKGYYSDNFEISKEPNLGNWTLKVIIGGKYALEEIVEFEVNKYVLPKFMVYIETDENFAREDRYININVYGRYTYNKYVEGKVNLTVRTRSLFGESFWNSTMHTTERAKFVIDIEDLDKLSRSNLLLVTATLMEAQTNIAQNVTTTIYIKYKKYNIIIPDAEIEFQNEIPYRLKAKVEYWNGSIVYDPETSMIMKHGPKTYEARLDDKGMATFEFDYSEKDQFTFSYKNSTEKKLNFLSYMYRSKADESSAKCGLKVKNKGSKLIEIIVESDQNIPYIVYTVTSHANIIKNQLVHLDSSENSYTIQLMASNEMVPVSFLYIHYLINGNLIFCETKLEFPEELENKLSISSPTNVQPGDIIDMTITAQPGSQVSIVAIDLSSFIYCTGSRIDKNNLFNSMRNDVSYVLGGNYKTPGILSGLATLTDGYYDSSTTTQGLKMVSVEGPSLSWDIVEIDNPQSLNYIRSNFPETWLYLDFDIYMPTTNITVKVPDSITTWVLMAFSLNDETGIGILDSSIKIIASKEFFINTYLPYSIKRGEIVSIPIVIFNYHSENLNTDVIMENSLSQFKFVDIASNRTTNSLSEKQNVIVPANGGKRLNFLIYPQKLGEIEIYISAQNNLATDEVLQNLIVEPDGLSISSNQEVYVSVTPGEDVNIYLESTMPVNVEPDSEFLQLSISGDALLPSLNNLDDLVDKPTGCGEQNMIHFAPNILVLEYLGATRQTSKYAELVAKAKKYIDSGYQNQMKFRHSNGGYSVFGQGHSREPSNWLTAYVVRFFIKALKYLPIETTIIESSLNYLTTQQLSSGEFKTAGYLFHPAYQSRYGFTAFVLMSFLENAKYSRKYKSVVQKALDFLSNNIHEIDDVYSLSIMATAFQMAKHEQASFVLEKLKPLAKNTNELQWWEDNTDDRVTDIEITSYILLALLYTPGQYLPIAKWLLEQRNNQGGFKSTQDTVVGLQALIKFSQFTMPQNETLIKLSYRALNIQNEELENGILGLDPDNVEILQHQELPPATRSIDIELSGTGNIFLQFSYQYRKSLVEKPTRVNFAMSLPKSFIIETKAELESDNSLTMNLELCIKYTPLNDVKYLKTNMIIAEVDLPSGFIANDESLDEIRNSDIVDRIEYDKTSQIVLYFTSIGENEEKCIYLLADKKDDVRNLKPSMIKVYEYYHSDRQEVVMYQLKNNDIV